MDEQKQTETKTSRRTFVKYATAMITTALAALAPKADAAEKLQPKEVLYSETDEWKKYYETLK